MQNERDVEFKPAPAANELDTSGRLDTSRELPSADGADPRARAEEVAHHTADRARNVASDLRERAGDRIESRMEDQKHRAADSLGSVAESLRTASRQMPEQEGLGRYMEKAANQVDHLASFLNNREITELMDNVEDYARRQPAAFVGGAFTLGVLGARFLRSSRRDLNQGRLSGGTYGAPRSGWVEDPHQDAVSRPDAPGYADPSERGDTGFGDSRSL